LNLFFLTSYIPLQSSVGQFTTRQASFDKMASYDKNYEATTAIEGSPEISKSVGYDKETYPEATGLSLPPATVSRITHVSSVVSVLVAGIALFSDGYNAQIIGYMEPLFSDL
jgi:hypothetical protein